jgi:hypothetical protein
MGNVLLWGMTIVAGLWGVESIVDSSRDDNDSLTVGLTPATIATIAAIGVGVYYLKKRK